MNKKIIAATLLMSLGAVSASYAANNYTGTQSFNGVINVPQELNHWEWSVGSAILLDGKISEMSNNGTIYNPNIAKDTLLLAGQTADVTIGSGKPGIRPKVELKNTDDSAINIDYSTATGGNGVIKLKVVSQTGNAVLGEMKLSVKAAGMGFSGDVSAAKSFSLLSSKDNANAILNGMLPVAGSMPLAEAKSWLSAIGVTKTLDSLLVSYNNKLAVSNKLTDSSPDVIDPSNANTYYGAVYGLAIKSGEGATLTFNSPVTKETKWKSALKVNITYL